MTTFEDWHAIQTLVMTYAELVDAGRFDAAAALFEHGAYRVELRHEGRTEVTAHRGTADVYAYMDRTVRYADGTPRTKHVNTNQIIEVDGDVATSRCYVTVFQQTDTLPLQPVAAGRYVDAFERADGVWRFTDRLITGFLVGDTSQHKAPPSR
jgi:3-phenylpropionate/cinnamic acid dioxygenase small subunit